jgi:hypothetical protein
MPVTLSDVFISIEEGYGSGFNLAFDGDTTSFVAPYNGPDSYAGYVPGTGSGEDAYEGYNFIIDKTSNFPAETRISVQVCSTSFIRDAYDISPPSFSTNNFVGTNIEFKLRVKPAIFIGLGGWVS